MKRLKIYLLKLDRTFILLLGSLLLILSCNKLREGIDSQSIEVDLLKKEKLDSNTLLITIAFKNNSDENYVLSIFPEYYLVKTKQGGISYDDIGKIKGKIISSDFANQMEDWEKGSKLLNTFYRKTFFNYEGANDFLLCFAENNSEAYSSYLLFLPRKSERKMIICFTSYKINNRTFNDAKTRVSANWEFFEPRAKVLDSLLKKEKINYTVYTKNISLKDSLLINK